MRSLILANWTSVSGNASATNPVYSIPQDAEEWVDVGDDVDATFFIDVRAVTSPGGTGFVTLNLETAPSKDESLFVPCAPPLTLGSANQSLASGSNPIVVQTAQYLSGTTLISTRLSKWLRWRMSVPSTATGTWSVEFRIRASATPFPFFGPYALNPPGTQTVALWLRADLGITFSGVTPTVTAWGDQSGSGNNMTGQGAPVWQPAGLGGMPAIAIGNPGYFSNAAGPTIAQGDSMFVVLQETAAQPTATFIDGVGANRQTASQTTNATTVTLNAGNAGVTATLNAPGFTAPTILQVDWNGASTAVYQNGVSITPSGSPGAQSFQIGYVGANQAGGSAWVGSIAEVILFNKILSANNRTRVTRYLGGRYGISVP
jgi:hypothetical protein